MEADPYFWTQDNGAGGPVHFATTYKQIDMLHHVLRNCPEAVNQRDPRGFTPLHRAAYLAQYDGGGDPTLSPRFPPLMSSALPTTPSPHTPHTSHPVDVCDGLCASYPPDTWNFTSTC
jgi:hypothetical protein